MISRRNCAGFVSLLCGCIFAWTLAARATGSIFSGLGYGVIEDYSCIRALGLGNAALALNDSLALNALNPALIASIKQTRISVGGYLSRQWMRDHQASDVDDWAQVEYFSIGILLQKGLALGFSLSPYSRVEFTYGWSGQIGGESYFQSYKGNGGLSRAALQLAWSPGPLWQIGGAASAIWGEVEELRGSYFDASGYQDVEFLRSKQWLAFTGTFGLLYQPHRRVTIGAIYEPEAPIHLHETFTYTNEDSNSTATEQYRLATRYGFGFSYQLSARLFSAAQLLYGYWSDLKELPGDAAAYRDSYELAAGAEWKPGDWNSDHFLRRLQYRWGGRWSVGYVKSQGSSVNSYIASIGVGYPFHEGRDRLDVSIEFGLRGDLSTNGGQETILKFRLGLNIGETWFVRPKPSWEE